ncbi:MAG: type II toxin-antitoxin system RelE/ParE family toxin [Anaerolinea sp.]|nr:type II toxin-antitoxin system RelE/ParE family toxin [Anaerolinea sp.]
MTTKPPVRVVATPHFARTFKRLRKKYRHIETDLKPLVEQLQQGETPGDQIQGTGYTVYKERLPSTDAQRGKSGGYRVIYYMKTQNFIYLIEIYPKSEREDISSAELSALLTEVQTELSGDNE